MGPRGRHYVGCRYSALMSVPVTNRIDISHISHLSHASHLSHSASRCRHADYPYYELLRLVPHRCTVWMASSDLLEYGE